MCLLVVVYSKDNIKNRLVDNLESNNQWQYLPQYQDLQLKKGGLPVGKGAAAMAEWMGNLQRFADFYNGHVFGGERVILPEDIEPTKGDTHKLEEDKDNKTLEVQRFRDVVMYWKKYGINLAILAIENQQKIHLAMPVRNMVYEGLTYQEQINLKWSCLTEEAKKKYSQEEWLSRYVKDQKLLPVITLVLYYGEEKWTLNQELHEMLDLKEIEENYPDLKPYIQNYKINLVDVSHMENINVFHSDLQLVFGMLKYKNNKKDLYNYILENAKYFNTLDKETALVIGEVLKAKKLIDKAGKMKEGGSMDMCQALDDMVNDAMEEGKGLMLADQIRKKLIKNKSILEIAEELEETVEVIERTIKEHNI